MGLASISCYPLCKSSRDPGAYVSKCSLCGSSREAAGCYVSLNLAILPSECFLPTQVLSHLKHHQAAKPHSLKATVGISSEGLLIRQSPTRNCGHSLRRQLLFCLEGCSQG